MGFNYNEYVKRGNNPLLLEEEMNPNMPPSSKSELRKWFKEYYIISADDIETFLASNSKLINTTEWRTAEGIEASLKKSNIPFERKNTDSTADNDSADNDAAVSQDQNSDLRERWNGMKNLLSKEFTKVRQEIEEKFDIDVNINDQQDFLKSNAYKSFADPNKDQNTIYKERIEAMSVYFEDGKVNADKLEEDFKDFLRERGYGSLQDVGPENRPDDYEEKQDEEQPEEPQKVNKEVEVAKQEIVEDLTDKSKPFNLSEKIDSITSYLAQKGKELFADTEEEILKEKYEELLKYLEESAKTKQSFGDEDLNDIFERLYYLKFVEYTPLTKFKSIDESMSTQEIDRFILSIRREIFNSDAMGIAKGLKTSLAEPQLSQVLDLIYSNLDNIAMQNEGWDNSDNIITSIFTTFKEQTGLNLQDYLPNEINLNIPPTAYEARVEELEEFFEDKTLNEIKNLTSSDNEYKEVLAQYHNVRLKFLGKKDLLPGSTDKQIEILPEQGSEGETKLIKDIVEFVNTPYMPYNDYAYYWLSSFVGSPLEGYRAPHMTAFRQWTEPVSPEEYFDDAVLNDILQTILNTFDPKVQQEMVSILMDKEVSSFISNYLKFNLPYTRQMMSVYDLDYTRDNTFSLSSSDVLPSLGSQETGVKFDNELDLMTSGLFPALNKLIMEKFGTDASLFPFGSPDQFIFGNNVIETASFKSERNKKLILDILEKELPLYQNNINLKKDLIDSYQKAIDSIKEIDDQEIQNAASAVLDAINRGDIDGAERARTVLSMKITEQNGIGIVKELILWNDISKEKAAAEQLELFLEDIKKLDVDDINFKLDLQDLEQSPEDLNKVITRGIGDDETDLPTDSDDDIDVDPLQELIKGSISSLLLEESNDSEISFIEVMNYISLIRFQFLISQRVLENQITLFNNLESIELSKDSIYNFVTNEYKNYLNIMNSNKIPSFESTKFYNLIELALVQVKYLEQMNQRIEKKFSK